jgi:hypothetical protein
VIAISTACGNASGSLSPTGPSAGGSTGGAMITGRVNGTSALGINANSFKPQADSSLHVTISGTNISTTVDGTGQFTLTGVPPGTVTLQFSGPGVSASITISGVTTGEQIHVDVTLSGGSAHVDSESRHKSDDGREIEGKITAVDATAHTITIGSTVVSIPDGAKIHRGSTTLAFADLKVGVEVEVHAAMDGTTLRASDISIEDENDNDDDDHDGLTDVSGTVSALSGQCPTLTFTVQTRTVKTTNATTFDGGCSIVKANARVEVKGTLAADGTLAATRVSIDN